MIGNKAIVLIKNRGQHGNSVMFAAPATKNTGGSRKDLPVILFPVSQQGQGDISYFP